MKGKERCRILKEIRQRIADENGIEFVTSECKHKGDCRGTCPKCESEVIYLERELAKRQRLGKSIAVAGIAATMVFSATACTDPDPIELGGDIPYVENETDGIIAEPPENDGTDNGELMGEPVEIQGDLAPDVPYIDENGNEAILPDCEMPIPGEVVDSFFPETPEEYEGYDGDFIYQSTLGMTVFDIVEAWGEPDMAQKSGDRAVIAYFTDTQDIVFQHYVESGEIINVTVMENNG